jgi:hypothetical protein
MKRTIDLQLHVTAVWDEDRSVVVLTIEDDGDEDGAPDVLHWDPVGGFRDRTNLSHGEDVMVGYWRDIRDDAVSMAMAVWRRR